MGMDVGSDWASPLVLRTSHPRNAGMPGQGSPKVRACLPKSRGGTGSHCHTDPAGLSQCIENNWKLF